MILIDKSKAEQTLILTLTELTTGNDPEYILSLTGDGNRDIFNISLSGNTSNFKERFDQFNIPTSQFSDLPDGIYTYSVTLLNEVMETGKALVKSENITEIIQPNSSLNDQYLIYGE